MASCIGTLIILNRGTTTQQVYERCKQHSYKNIYHSIGFDVQFYPIMFYPSNNDTEKIEKERNRDDIRLSEKSKTENYILHDPSKLLADFT